MNQREIFFSILLFILILQIYCYSKNKSLYEILYPDDFGIIFNEKKYEKTKIC